MWQFLYYIYICICSFFFPRYTSWSYQINPLKIDIFLTWTRVYKKSFDFDLYNQDSSTNLNKLTRKDYIDTCNKNVVCSTLWSFSCFQCPGLEKSWVFFWKGKKSNNVRARNSRSISFHRHRVNLMLSGRILKPSLARKQKTMMRLNHVCFLTISFPPRSASWPRPRSLIGKRQAVCVEAALVEVVGRLWQWGSWMEYRSQLG